MPSRTGKNSNLTADMKGNTLRLIGPFKQLITMDRLPVKGPLTDDQLEIINNAGILVNGEVIESVGPFSDLHTLAAVVETVEGDYTAMPGMVDAHTHICWAGSRSGDYAMRLAGKNYLDIARKGGGIWSTVNNIREASLDELTRLTAGRAKKLLLQGTTTIEVKSGYGLNADAELKMLTAIQQAGIYTQADLVATCLAAHIMPKDFKGSGKQYLEYIIKELLPVVKAKNLAGRVDSYIDDGAFSADDGLFFLTAAKNLGFDVVVHADQFSPGGLKVAVEAGALSADHLETSTDEDIRLLAGSHVIPVALPGASLGLGAGFAPARKILNAGASLAIASDWNPGSAPMGNLLMQASILGVYEKLTMAETLAAITYRASAALKMNDRGILKPAMLADFIAFPCANYREILYNQGGMMPEMVWKRGQRV
jgi:imidazolonepropionase